MKTIKVGILTLHDCVTEGGIVQAVALKTAVEQAASLSGNRAEVTFINYVNGARAKHVESFRAKRAAGAELAADDRLMYRHLDALRVVAFRNRHVMPQRHLDALRVVAFRNRHVVPHLSPPGPAITSVSAYTEHVGQYDIVIIGSDEIWKEDDPVYFGAACPPTVAVVTYGGCVPAKHEAIVRKLANARALAKQRMVVCRDLGTLAIVESLGISEVTKVTYACDPCVLTWHPKQLGAPQPGHPLLSYVRGQKVSKEVSWHPVIESSALLPHIDEWACMQRWCDMPLLDCSVVITSKFHPTHMGILGSRPVITVDSRRKTVEVMEYFYGREFCLDSLDQLTPGLVTRALESFDINPHNARVQAWRDKGRDCVKFLLDSYAL